MVQTKVRSIDRDGHVIEDLRRLLEHMEASYRECGGSWVPWWLDRVDEEYEHRGAEEAPDLKHKLAAKLRRGLLLVGLE
jgi:hypothetical protein